MTHLQIGNIIRDNRSFAIISHTSPDGDNVGSMLALYSILLNEGKQVDVFNDDPVPDRYLFLPYSDKIRPISEVKNYDCVFALDCGDSERLGKSKELIGRSGIVANIDHHVSNDMYGTINLVVTTASSTGEVLYDIFTENGFKINRDIAACLYTSILTDTGGFKYSNTTGKALHIAGDLIQTGIDFPKIYSDIYDKKSIAQVRLMSRVVETLDIACSGKAAFLTLFHSMLEECDAVEEDASEFINISRDIEGVEVAVLIKEKASQSYRISLRSKTSVDVRLIAESFGGGGHIRAAGCTIEGSYEETKKALFNEIRKHLE